MIERFDTDRRPEQQRSTLRDSGGLDDMRRHAADLLRDSDSIVAQALGNSESYAERFLEANRQQSAQ